MKHLKFIGLAAVAAMALMAFASTASATQLTSPTGTVWNGKIHATLEGSATLRAGFANITCTTSTVEGTSTGGGVNSTETVDGPIEVLTFGTTATPCNATVNVITKGSLEIHTIAGTENGTLTGKNSEVTVSTLGVSCVYGTGAGTDLGTLTGGSPATMDINAELTKISGGFGCSNPAHWEGAYTVTSPTSLYVSP